MTTEPVQFEHLDSLNRWYYWVQEGGEYPMGNDKDRGFPPEDREDITSRHGDPLKDKVTEEDADDD